MDFIAKCIAIMTRLQLEIFHTNNHLILILWYNKRMKKTGRFYPGLTAVFYTTLVLFSLLYPSSARAVAVGACAPDFKATDLNPGGRSAGISDQKDKVVLLNLWASWCPTCRAEMPGFYALEDDYSARGFHVMAVSLDTSRENAVAYQDTLRKQTGRDPNFSMLHDSSHEIGHSYTPRGFPVSYLIDREGRILKMFIGSFNEQGFKALRTDIETAIKAPAPGAGKGCFSK